MLYYVGGDQKLLVVRVSGELKQCLLENKNALTNDNCVVFPFFLGIFAFSELDYKFFMLIHVSSFMAVKTSNAGQAARVYNFQKSGFLS